MEGEAVVAALLAGVCEDTGLALRKVDELLGPTVLGDCVTSPTCGGCRSCCSRRRRKTRSNWSTGARSSSPAATTGAASSSPRLAPRLHARARGEGRRGGAPAPADAASGGAQAGGAHQSGGGAEDADRARAARRRAGRRRRRPAAAADAELLEAWASLGLGAGVEVRRSPRVRPRRVGAASDRRARRGGHGGARRRRRGCRRRCRRGHGRRRHPHAPQPASLSAASATASDEGGEGGALRPSRRASKAERLVFADIDGLDGDENDAAARRFALQTLQVFVPLAHRLGMWYFKSELEQRCFALTRPAEFATLSRELEGVAEAHAKTLQDSAHELRAALLADPVLSAHTEWVRVQARTGRLLRVYQDDPAGQDARRARRPPRAARHPAPARHAQAAHRPPPPAPVHPVLPRARGRARPLPAVRWRPRRQGLHLAP